jgi:ABC-type Fe3+ transport system substrate-binding protein
MIISNPQHLTVSRSPQPATGSLSSLTTQHSQLNTSSFPFILHPSSFIISVLLLSLQCACHKKHEGDRLIAISPHPETTLYEFQWAFQPWYRERTGRNVEIVWLDQGGTSKMQRFLYSEFQRAPEGVGIDMVWGGGLETYLELASRNLLRSYQLPDPLLRAIPPDYGGIPFYDAKYRWYATVLTGFGIIYNRRVLDLQELPTPQTWTDLADPAFLSWVGSADPRQSGTAHMAFEIILQAYGWERGWEVITALGANINSFTRLASDVPRDTALGEIAAGFCIDNYAYAQMALVGRGILGYVMPEGLTIINPDGIAILRGAPNLRAAQMFIEFVMSQPGQRLLMTRAGRPGGPRQFNIGRMAIIPPTYDQLGDDSLVAVNPFRLKPALKYDSKKGAVRQKLLDDLIGVLVIENHQVLKRAWRAANSCDPKRRPDLYRWLAQMPLTEDEATTLARDKWNNPVARNQIMVEWSHFAWEKYSAVLREAEGEPSAQHAR